MPFSVVLNVLSPCVYFIVDVKSVATKIIANVIQRK
jgi:hypothetical protein